MSKRAQVIQVDDERALVIRADGSSCTIPYANRSKEYEPHQSIERAYFVSGGKSDARDVFAWLRSAGQTLADAVDPEGLAEVLEIHGGNEIHALPWEAFREGFGDAAVIRRPTTSRSMDRPTRIPTQCINVLLVIARPFGESDIRASNIQDVMRRVAFQTGGRIRVDVLRGGANLGNLKHRLRSRSATNRYNVVHFDVHGAVKTDEEVRQTLATRGVKIVPKDDDEDADERAFILMEGEHEEIGKPPPTDVVGIGRLARVLSLSTRRFEPPELVVFNACESAASSKNLALSLVEHGVRASVGFRHPVTFDEASVFAEGFYPGLADPGASVCSAFHGTYLRVVGNPERPAVSLPALFIDGARDFGFEVNRPSLVYNPRPPDRRSRDYDEMQLDRMLFGNREANRLAIVGPRGVGKSEFLGRIAESWTACGFADRTCLVKVSDLLALDDKGAVALLRDRIGAAFGVPSSLGEEELSAAEVIGATQEFERLLLIDGIDAVEADTPVGRELRDAIRALNSNNDWVLATSRVRSPENTKRPKRILGNDALEYSMVWDHRQLNGDGRQDVDRSIVEIARRYGDGVIHAGDSFVAAANDRQPNPNDTPESWLMDDHKMKAIFDAIACSTAGCTACAASKIVEHVAILGLVSGPPFPCISSRGMRSLLGASMGLARTDDADRAKIDMVMRHLEAAGYITYLNATWEDNYQMWLLHPQLVVASRRALLDGTKSLGFDNKRKTKKTRRWYIERFEEANLRRRRGSVLARRPILEHVE